MQLGPVSASSQSASPVVITDASWYQLADDIAVSLAATRDRLVWVTAERGAGKSAWLQSLIPTLQKDYLLLDPRNQQKAEAALELLSQDHSGSVQAAPTLILDNFSPSDLMSLMAEPGHPVRSLVSELAGPLLMLSPEQHEDRVAVRRLERVMGRSLIRHELPHSSREQNRSILVAHRPGIESRWNVRITDAAMGMAVSGLKYRATPGEVVEWLESAAARTSLVADEGPGERRRLRAELETLGQRIASNQETGEPVEALEQQRLQLSLEIAAAEVDWLERQASGTLRQVLPEDLQFELESLTGSSDHPELYVSTGVPGGVLSAGSGNLRS